MPAPDDFLALSDAALLAQCDVDVYRASGPGGQKRNKTSSAVRLRHQPTGVQAIANESRSQHDNRAKALRRLRARIAFDIRRPVSLDDYACPPEVASLLSRRGPSVKHRDYPAAVQALLDLFAAAGCSVRDAAAAAGVTSAAMSRALVADESLHRVVNELRAGAGLKPLKR